MDWAYLKNVKDGEQNNRAEANRNKLGSRVQYEGLVDRG